jgi:hypothetical protein
LISFLYFSFNLDILEQENLNEISVDIDFADINQNQLAQEKPREEVKKPEIKQKEPEKKEEKPKIEEKKIEKKKELKKNKNEENPKKKKVENLKTEEKKIEKPKTEEKKNEEKQPEEQETDKLKNEEKPEEKKPEIVETKPKLISAVNQNMENSIEKLGLSAREKFNISNQIKRCYRKAIKENGKTSDIIVIVSIGVALDGRIISNLGDIIDFERYNDASNPEYKIAVDNVYDALKYCNPLRNLPADKYEKWQSITLQFDGRSE